MADDSPSREDAHAALTALCAGAYGPKGGRKDYLFHLSSYHARVLMDLFGNLEAKCRQNRLEFDPTPAAPDQAEGPRAPKAPRIPRFQVEKVRIHGERSDGSQYIRETYRVVANVGLGRKKANRIVGVLSQLRESQQVPNSQLTPNNSHIRSWDDPTMKMREIL